MISIFRLYRLTLRFAEWVTPHVQRFIDQFNANAREAEQNFQKRHYREAAKYYAASLQDANRRRYSASKKARIVIRLGESLRLAGDLDAAIEVAKEAVERTGKFGERDALYGQALEVLSKVKEDRGESAEALELARQALTVAAKSNTDLGVCAERCGRLAALERAAGNAERSKELLEESINFYRRSHGEHHPETATQLAAMALMLQEQGQFGEAFPLFEQAYTVHQQSLGGNARETLKDLEHMGQLQYMQGNLDAAQATYAKLTRLKETEIGVQAVEHGQLLIDAATVHEAAGEYNKALEFLMQARQKVGRDATFGPVIVERLARLSA